MALTSDAVLRRSPWHWRMTSLMSWCSCWSSCFRWKHHCYETTRTSGLARSAEGTYSREDSAVVESTCLNACLINERVSEEGFVQWLRLTSNELEEDDERQRANGNAQGRKTTYIWWWRQQIDNTRSQPELNTMAEAINESVVSILVDFIFV